MLDGDLDQAEVRGDVLSYAEDKTFRVLLESRAVKSTGSSVTC